MDTTGKDIDLRMAKFLNPEHKPLSAGSLILNMKQKIVFPSIFNRAYRHITPHIALQVVLIQSKSGLHDQNFK